MTLIAKYHPRRACTSRKPKTKRQPEFLTLQEFGLRQYVLEHLNPEGLFNERAKAVAKYFGCTHPTISKVINQLVAKGCFEVVKETNSQGGQAEKTLRPLNHVGSLKQGNPAEKKAVKLLSSGPHNPLQADLNLNTNSRTPDTSTVAITTNPQSIDGLPISTNNPIQGLSTFKGVSTEERPEQPPAKQPIATLRPGTRMRVSAPVTEKDVSPLLPVCPYCRETPCDWGVFDGWLHIEATCGEKKCENAHVFGQPPE